MERMIVGLGNPGDQYEKTRHNAGWLAITTLAAKHGMKFRRQSELSAKIAQGMMGDEKVFLVLPLTYMNSSGEAVRLCSNYFRILLENLLIVCDDIALPFGELRLRKEGSSGGHNGLKSIESHLGTQLYARLRIGVGDRLQGDLADHVLGHFSSEEEEKFPTIIDEAVEIIEKWTKHETKKTTL
jgi:peptidyl-tRNA hydrolase, PTH1 family